MKDLKNIIVDFWELLFPLFIRIFLSGIILLFILVNPREFFLPIKIEVQYFFQESHSFLSSLQLNNYFALYLLILLILVAITLNKALALFNSSINVSIGWDGKWSHILLEDFCKMLDYFPNSTIEHLESEIQMIYSKSLMTNEHNLKGENDIIARDMAKYNQYVEILIFEIFFILAFAIIFFNQVKIINVIIILVLIVLLILAVLNRQAIRIKFYVNRLLTKIEFILAEKSGSFCMENKEIIAQRKTSLGLTKRTRWWYIRVRMIFIRINIPQKTKKNNFQVAAEVRDT